MPSSPSPPGDPTVFTDELDHLTLRLAAQRDERAWQQILRCVYRRVRLLLGQRAVVDDLAQIACLKIARALDDGRLPGAEQGAAIAWVNTVAANVVIDHIRQTRRSSEGSSVPLDDVADADLDPPESPHREADRLLRLDEALESLGAEHRGVVLLYYLEDLTYAEIAARLDIRPNTVKSRLSRALSRLRGLLRSPDTKALWGGNKS